MDDMKISLEVTNTQNQRGRKAHVPSLFKYREDDQTTDDIKTLARFHGYTVPIWDRVAIVETTVNNKVPPHQPPTQLDPVQWASQGESGNGHHCLSSQNSTNQKSPKLR